MRRLLVLGALLWGAPAAAQEYRRVSIADGRQVVARIEGTTATGLNLAIPQGRLEVRFDQVVSLEEVTAGVYQAQEPWTVVVVPPLAQDLARAPELAELLLVAAQDLPATTVTTPDRLSRLDQAERAAFAACGSNASCLQGYLDLSGATAVVSAKVAGTDAAPEIVVGAIYRQAPRSRREVGLARPASGADYQGILRQAVETALHLQARPVALPPAQPTPAPLPPVQPPAEEPVADGTPLPPADPPSDPAPLPAPPEQQPAPEPPAADPAAADPAAADPAPGQPPAARGGPSDATLRALAWVPLPGTPSLARKDWGGFAASMGVALPGSALMVGIAGQASFTREQLIATGVGSFYILTVAMNKAIGLRGLDAGVAVQPRTDGGLVIGVQGPLGGPAHRGKRAARR